MYVQATIYMIMDKLFLKPLIICSLFCCYSVHSKIVYSSLLVKKQHLMKYTISFELFVNYINKIFM